MGPLVVQGIVSHEWNYFFAFIIGIGFGFVLEQAGFSTSRKLAGLFYGYDFVVLRVFFTAGITAMLGLLFFNYFGWIDISKIVVNRLYIPSAIVGGVIMGIGFILGGFCPGTSVCAAAIGKIDAMFFIVGVFIGEFILFQLYPAIESFYKAGAKGKVLINESLGLSSGVFAFLLVAVAIGMFVVITQIEKRVKKVDY